MTRDELIAALEKATGPDRELDAELHKHVVGLRMYESIVADGDDFFLRYYPGPPGPEYCRLPRYTATPALCIAALKGRPE